MNIAVATFKDGFDFSELGTLTVNENPIETMITDISDRQFVGMSYQVGYENLERKLVYREYGQLKFNVDENVEGTVYKIESPHSGYISFYLVLFNMSIYNKVDVKEAEDMINKLYVEKDSISDKKGSENLMINLSAY